jgi:hypothetical protein
LAAAAAAVLQHQQHCPYPDPKCFPPQSLLLCPRDAQLNLLLLPLLLLPPVPAHALVMHHHHHHQLLLLLLLLLQLLLLLGPPPPLALGPPAPEVVCQSQMQRLLLQRSALLWSCAVE